MYICGSAFDLLVKIFLLRVDEFALFLKIRYK